MVSILLLHKHYDRQHLDSVKNIMRRKGAPIIRCIWSDVYGVWMAVEGCHRIRAAKELGLTPVIKDIGCQKSVTYTNRDGSTKMAMPKMIEFLHNTATTSDIIDFG